MRVLLAESRPDVRSALRLFLEQYIEDLKMTALVKSTDLVSQVGKLCPDLLLPDWEWLGLRPANLLVQIRGLFPQMRTIVLSARPEIRGEALTAGADAFINKSDTVERMLETIQSVII